MADGLEITFEGFAQFNAMMTELAGPTAESVARRAMRAGGRVIQAAIAEAAPERPDLPSGTALPPGALKSDIELHITKESDGSISAYVEPGKLTMHAARWVEYGHKMVTGGRLAKGGSHVGNVPAHPFIRNSFESSESAALAAIEETIAEEINKAAAVLGAR
jgi:Bacteriophage HK97-gp10, putative tail-component